MSETQFSPPVTFPVEAIVFDLGGVLVDNAGIAEIEQWMVTPVPPSELWHRWLVSPAVRAFESGQIDAATFSVRMIEEFDLRLDAEQFKRAIASLIRGLYPGALELLDTLRERYCVACLSNTNEIHWQRMDTEFGLLSHFDVTIASHLVGQLKPGEEIYRTLLDRLALPPERVLFLDDTQLNVDGARRIGIPSARVHGVVGARAALPGEILPLE